MVGRMSAGVYRFGRTVVKPVSERLGLYIRPYTSAVQGLDPWRDMQILLQSRTPPTILDVGANEGQSAQRFAGMWPGATIHSFEPSPSTFAVLNRNVETIDQARVHTVNAGVGANPGRLELQENSQSEMSSFLALAEEAWGETTNHTEVDVVTLDDYCASAGIDRVDLLKTDTQGYDFEVLKGADRLLTDGAVQLVFTEMIFSALYETVPAFDEVYRFLVDRGYALVGLYQPFHTEDGRMSFCDVLFMRSDKAKQVTGA